MFLFFVEVCMVRRKANISVGLMVLAGLASACQDTSGVAGPTRLSESRSGATAGVAGSARRSAPRSAVASGGLVVSIKQVPTVCTSAGTWKLVASVSGNPGDTFTYSWSEQFPQGDVHFFASGNTLEIFVPITPDYHSAFITVNVRDPIGLTGQASLSWRCHTA